MNKLTILFCFCFLFSFTLLLKAQGSCGQDIQGIPFCAPPNGTAVETIKGIACAPGKCAIDNRGYPKCSNTMGGGATVDNQGNVYCVGSCINPTREYCIDMRRNK